MATAKLSKKRVAAAQPGPVRKKLHLDKPAPAADMKKAHRKVPVTSARLVNDGSDGSDDEGDEGEWQDVREEGKGDEGFEDVDEMHVENEKGEHEYAPQKLPTKSARESHKVQKVLQQERRAGKAHADLLAVAKSLWAQARQKELPRTERTQAVTKLMAAVRGHVQDIVFKHDASRIVQTLVKYGSQVERNEVAAELKGRYRDLSQNKYSKFLVTKLIRTCPAHRAAILLEFRGHVVRLLLHREASSVLADAYELYANAYERALLLHDFYGREVALFSAALGKGVSADNKEKAQLKKGLAGVLEGADVEKRKRILAAVKEKLELVMNNPEKGAISHAIFHRVLWEYLSQVNEFNDEALGEKLRRELFEACQEQLAEMVHTKDGSRVVREFIAQGTAKDRKQVVKVLKPHVEQICKDDEAQFVLFTALDVIDDTKLTAKSLVAEITARAATLYASPQGRRALLYLLVPRVSRHFTPAQSALLAETDRARARTSKKDGTLRHEEILKAASAPLLALLEDEEKVEKLLRDPGGSLLVVEVMLYAEGDKSKAADSLLCLLQQPYPAPTNVPPHVIDVPHACRAYKTLLQGGHYSHQTHAVVRVAASSFSPAQFASAWLRIVGRERTRAMGAGGGTFVLAALVERVKAEGTEEEKEEVRGWFNEAYRKEVKEGRAKGKKVLLDALET